MSSDAQPAMQIIYDGACPFCSSYVRMIRLKESVGEVEFISARETQNASVSELLDNGYDLDAGMAVIYNGKIYHGADAVHMLTLLSTRYGFFNRLMKWLFSNRRVTRFAYPFLRLMRNIAVRIKGKPRISKNA